MKRKILRSALLGIAIGLIICVYAANWRAENFPVVNADYSNDVSIVKNDVKVSKVAMENIEPEWKSLGEFKLTAYCPCEKCCGEYASDRPVDDFGNVLVLGSNGTILEEGKSIAVDPTVIPYGTELVINGHTYIAQDCGGAIKGNRMDVYFADHESALDFGVQYAEVFALVGE